MTSRKGEKLGWTLGWLGSILWAMILAAVFLFKGLTLAGVSGLALTGIAVAMIFALAPWRRPAVRYWKLMAPMYGVLIIMIFWAVWGYNHLEPMETVWNLTFLVGLTPLFLPLITIGKRRWNDG